MHLENSIKTGSRIVSCSYRFPLQGTSEENWQAIYEHCQEYIHLLVCDLEDSAYAFEHRFHDDPEGLSKSDVRQLIRETEEKFAQ